MTSKLHRVCLVFHSNFYPTRTFNQSGFTLIELVTVIVVLGVLSIYVMPRSFIGKDFYDKGFHDETLSYLRYAQKAAIAQRRTVCVSFTNNSLFLKIATDSSNLTCNLEMVDANGNMPAILSARSGTAYVTRPVNFNFNALGQPVNQSNSILPTQTWRVANTTRSIVVETDTGYVHE